MGVNIRGVCWACRCCSVLTPVNVQAAGERLVCRRCCERPARLRHAAAAEASAPWVGVLVIVVTVLLVLLHHLGFI